MYSYKYLSRIHFELDKLTENVLYLIFATPMMSHSWSKASYFSIFLIFVIFMSLYWKKMYQKNFATS